MGDKGWLLIWVASLVRLTTIMVHLKNTLVFYLVSCLVLQPLFASPRKVAVVEVFQPNTPKELANLRSKLEKKLELSKKVEVVPPEKIAEVFHGKEEVSSAEMVEGDFLLKQADKPYFDLDTKKTLVLLDQAIDSLEKKPGVNGSLVKAYLFKAQVYLDENKTEEAVAAASKAVANNLSQSKLDYYAYNPKLQRFYEKVYQKFTKDHPPVNLKIEVVGSKSLPVYINGTLRGNGPTLVVPVIPNSVQLVSAGSASGAKAVKINADQKNLDTKITGSLRQSAKSAAKTIGFTKGTTEELAADAVSLGRKVSSQEVILMELTPMDYFNRLTLSVVDVNRGLMSKPKQIDVVDLNDDLDSAANVSADYLMNLPRNVFVDATKVSEDNPVLIGSKPKKKKTLLYVILGVVVIGAGAGAAIALGAGSGSGSGVGVGGSTPN